jgi:1-aminocyclopropane-1-carboxylate deaminase
MRLDQVHLEVSGNKFFKLKYNLEEAKTQKKSIILTFGGAFSNHIAATAYAGKLHGLKTVGVIRGKELAQKWHEKSRLARRRRTRSYQPTTQHSGRDRTSRNYIRSGC